MSDLSKSTSEPTDDSCPACGTELEVLTRLNKQVGDLQRQVNDLTKQVHTDPLTGLSNFRHFTKALDYEIERTQRTGQPTTVIMVDLDHFKKINDTHGHEVGNLVLAHTARLLKKNTRKLDIACRYGGEEFVIILPSTDLLTGTQVAERLRRDIESTRLKLDNQNLRVTASLGVDMYARDGFMPQEEFLQQVDALLYQAKENGRNQVCAGTRRDMQPDNLVTNDEKDALFSAFSNYESDSDENGDDEDEINKGSQEGGKLQLPLL